MWKALIIHTMLTLCAKANMAQGFLAQSIGTYQNPLRRRLREAYLFV